MSIPKRALDRFLSIQRKPVLKTIVHMLGDSQGCRCYAEGDTIQFGIRHIEFYGDWSKEPEWLTQRLPSDSALEGIS